MWNTPTEKKKLTLEFIAGLIVGEGTFYWTKSRGSQWKTPSFALRMHVRDRELVTMVRDSLGLTEKVHEYKHSGRHYVHLFIRHPGDLKNKLIPFIYPLLQGYKLEQFIHWFHQFTDEDTAENYKFIFQVFKKQFPELYILRNVTTIT